MKLYIKQKVFSWKDKFAVYDDNVDDKYYVEGEFLSFGKKLHVYDLRGNQVAFISQKMLRFLPRFLIYVNGRGVAEIVKQFTLIRQKYSIGKLDWEIDGDFWSHNYEITKKRQTYRNNQ